MIQMVANYPGKVLIVEDEALVRRLLIRILQPQGYRCETVADAAEAREYLHHDVPDLILCDVGMPGESGVDLARWLSREHRDIGVVMVSAADDLQMADELFALGVYGYVVKPFTSTDVLMQVSMARRRRDLELENREYVRMLVSIALQRTTLLLENFREAERSQPADDAFDERSLHKMAQALEFRDQETGRHTERVSAFCRFLAEGVGLDRVRCEEIRLGSILHDVGKVAVPDRILFKPAALTDGEFETVKRHAEVGFHLLNGWPGRMFEVGSLIAFTHHERWDGAGYPSGLAGADIPIEGRITSVCDVFDALTTDRPYREAMGVDEAIETMTLDVGHFDPELLSTFVGETSVLTAMHGALS
jgi:putative two-component system response regulator